MNRRLIIAVGTDWKMQYIHVHVLWQSTPYFTLTSNRVFEM